MAGRRLISMPSSRACATAPSRWVPRYFPEWPSVGDEWRLANIQGAPPRKNGSCVIALKGEHAGDWHDFDGDDRRRTAQHAWVMGPGYPATNSSCLLPTEAGQQPGGRARSEGFPPITGRCRTRDRTHSWRSGPDRRHTCRTVPRDRGLNVTNVSDLLFHDDLTHWEAKRGYPGMVAIVRDAAGVADRASSNLSRPGKTKEGGCLPARKTLGAVGGGAVRLAAPRDGLIASRRRHRDRARVMTSCPDLPVWSVLSIQGHGGCCASGRHHRVLCCSQTMMMPAVAPRKPLRRSSHMEGRRVFLALPPRQGEDFNDLLLREGPAAVRALVTAATEINGRKSSFSAMECRFVAQPRG